jgi:hypothetical protein
MIIILLHREMERDWLVEREIDRERLKQLGTSFFSLCLLIAHVM